MEPEMIKPTAIDDVLPVIISLDNISDDATIELTSNEEDEQYEQ